MQFNTLLATFTALISVAAAAPDVLPNTQPGYTAAFSIQACGAEGSCKGTGGKELCNDRCKKCSGPSGKYKRGDCCGFLWQTCCCYYS